MDPPMSGAGIGGSSATAGVWVGASRAGPKAWASVLDGGRLKGDSSS